MGKIYLLKAIK